MRTGGASCRASGGCGAGLHNDELSSRSPRVDEAMKPQIVAELANYKNRMLPFMLGRGCVDKERAFFAIFSTIIGAIEIARLLPDPAMREKVLASTREVLLRSF